MLIHQIEIIARPSEDIQSLKVKLNQVEYLVTLNNKNIDNIAYFNKPIDAIGKRGKQFIEATSIDADTFFVIYEFVNTFININKE